MTNTLYSTVLRFKGPLLATGLVLGLAACSADDSAAESAEQTAIPDVAPITELNPFLGEKVLGSPDATVTVIEYASLTCHACGNFHNYILPDLQKNYIDTGKIQFVFREYPLDRYA